MTKITFTVQQKSFIFIVLAAIIGGSVPVAGKFVLQTFQPFTLVMLRFAFATLTLLPLAQRSQELSLSYFKDLFWVGLIGALNPILFFIALQYTQAAFVPLIYAGVPALTVIYFYLAEGKKVSQTAFFGILVGLIGISITVITPLFVSARAGLSLMGNLVIFMASIAFLFYGVLSHRKQKKFHVSPVALTFYFSLVTFLVSLPFAAAELLSQGLPTTSSLQLFSVFYLGVIGTALFYLLYQYAVKHGNSVTASLFTYIQPISGIGLAIVLLGESVSFPFFVGGFLAILGAHLASQQKTA